MSEKALIRRRGLESRVIHHRIIHELAEELDVLYAFPHVVRRLQMPLQLRIEVEWSFARWFLTLWLSIFSARGEPICG